MTTLSVSQQSLPLIDYFTQFNLWTPIHYFAFKHRLSYLNLFTFYFPIKGTLISNITDDERQTLFSFISLHKENINGFWGFLSQLIPNKNGLEIYDYISHTEFFEMEICVPCYYDATMDDNFIEGKKIEDKTKKILLENNNKYESILKSFETYLEEFDKDKYKQYKLFDEMYSNDNMQDNNNNENNKAIFAYNWKEMNILINERKFNQSLCENNGIVFMKEITNGNNNNGSVIEDDTDKSTNIVSPHKEHNRNYRREYHISFDSSDDDSSDYDDRNERDYGVSKLKVNFNERKKKKKTVEKKIPFEWSIQFLEHKQKDDGYASDFTKNVYYEENKFFYSDDDNIKTNLRPKRRRKIHRVPIKGKTIINNINLDHKTDNLNIGIERLYEDEKDKLIHGLCSRRYSLIRRKNNKKNRKKKNNGNMNTSFVGDGIIKGNNSNNNSLIVTNFSRFSNNGNNQQLRHYRTNFGDLQELGLKNVKKHNTNNSKRKSKKRKDNDSSVSDNKSVSSMSVESFNSLFSQDFYRNIQNKKKKHRQHNHIEDNLKNHSINSYIPIINDSSVNEKPVLIRISRLLNNYKFTNMFELVAVQQFVENINQLVNNQTAFMTKTANEINNEVLNSITNQNGEYQLTPEIIIPHIYGCENSIDIYNKLLSLYFDILISVFNLYININESSSVTIVDTFKQIETLLKVYTQAVIKQNTSSTYINNASLYTVETKTTSIFNKFMYILITHIIPSNELPNGFIKTYSITLYTFISIITHLTQNITQTTINEKLLKFIKLIVTFLLILIWTHSAINTKQLPETFENITSLLSLYIQLSEMYFEIKHMKSDNASYEMLNIIFNEYLYDNHNILSSNSNTFNNEMNMSNIASVLYNDLEKYLSPGITCLSPQKFEKSLNVEIKKYFIYYVFEMTQLRTFSIELASIFQNKLIYVLLYRYLFTFISFFALYKNNNVISPISYFNKNCLNIISNNGSELNNYYDVDSLFRKVNQNSKMTMTVEKNIIEKYFLSDAQLAYLLIKNWQCEYINILDTVKSFYSLLSFTSRKDISLDSTIITNNIYKLIPIIINTNNEVNIFEYMIQENMKVVVQFIVYIYLIFEHAFAMPNLNEETTRNKFYSRFLSNISTYKNSICCNCLVNNNYKLNVLIIVSIIVTFVQCSINFTLKKNVENALSKINEYIQSERTARAIRSFSLSIWINIVHKITSKQIDIDINKYIDLISKNITQVINEYKRSTLSIDYQAQCVMEELNETVKVFLLCFKDMTDNNFEFFLINNYVIINNIKDILHYEYYFPFQFREIVLDIIESILLKLDKKIQTLNVISIEDDFAIDLGDLDMAKPSQDQITFLMYVKSEILPLLNGIINEFTSINNANKGKTKIHFNLYEKAIKVEAVIIGIFMKYNIIMNSYEYCVKLLKESYFFKVPLPTYPKIICVNEHEDDFRKIPFTSMTVVLEVYSNLITREIELMRFNNGKIYTLKHLLTLFMLALFSKDKPTISTYPIMKFNFTLDNRIHSFIMTFCDTVNNALPVIQQYVNELKNISAGNEFEKVAHREKISIMNLYLLIGNNIHNSNDNNNNLNIDLYSFLHNDIINALTLDSNCENNIYYDSLLSILKTEEFIDGIKTFKYLKQKQGTDNVFNKHITQFIFEIIKKFKSTFKQNPAYINTIKDLLQKYGKSLQWSTTEFDIEHNVN